MSQRVLTILMAAAAALLFATGAVAALLIVNSGDDDEDSTADVTISTSGKGSLGLTVTVNPTQGLRVASLSPEGAAAKAGLQVGDYIRSVDGQVVRTPEQLRAAVESKAPGTRVSLTYERGDRESQVNVRLGEADSNAQIESTPPPQAQAPNRGTAPMARAELGLQIQNITPQLVSRFNLTREAGIVITQVVPNSAAGRAGFRAGDIILAVNGTTVTTADQVTRAVMATASGQQVSVGVLRGSDEMTIQATLTATQVLPGLDNLPPPLRSRVEELVRSGRLTAEQLQRLVEGQTNLRVGTVKAVNSTSLTIAPLEGGDDVTYTLTAQTEYRFGANDAGLADVQAGSTVAVISLDGQTAIGVLIFQR